MAVLKRGDKCDALKLDAARSFASSFMIAWNLICGEYRKIFAVLWFPCVLSGAFACLWLGVSAGHSYYGISALEIIADFAWGALFLFVWSAMRNMQKAFITQEEEAGNSIIKFFKAIKPTIRTCAPLCVAWAISYFTAYVLLKFDFAFYVTIPSVVALVIVLFPVAGIIQSYLESNKDRFFSSLKNATKLNLHYWGGMAILFVVSLMLLVVIASVLYFGEVVIACSFQNEAKAVYMGEELTIPSYVVVLKYCIMFVVTMMLSYAQIVWSLPQQVHIKSIIYKSRNRAERKNTGLPESNNL